ncbi:retrovirus-related pol polyprotein from transposon TNT 1-94 [Tanacetum coccineum]
MTTPITTSTTDSQMHNNIMAAGSRDRPPMLATGRYAQWRSRFLRYIDTKTNGDALRKCILEGPYIPSTVVIQVVPATENSPAVPEHTTVETILNMSPANKAHFESEKEAIHMILTGIGDEIYSTVDACNTAHEMWEAIERLQQGESLNIQDVKTNLFWEFGKFTSHDGESIESYYSRFYKLMNEMIRNNLTVDKMQVNVQFLQQLQPEWSRFVTIVKQQHKLDEVSYHKFFDILKQYQKEVNELRAERIAKNANPLALPITPPSESPSEEDSDPEQAQKDKEMQKNLALIAKYFKKLYKPTNNNLRTSSNTRNKNVDTTPRYKNDNQSGQFGNQRTMTVVGARETVGGHVVHQSGIQCFNCKEFGHFAKECMKPKWVKDITYHKEKILLGKQAEKVVQLQAEQSDWLADTDEEIDEQKLEAHYNYKAKIQEVPNTDSDMETVDSNVIPDLPDMCSNDIQTDQNDVECDDERVALANLIANLKLDVDENKKIQKQLKKANASLTQELKECKSTLAETSRTLGESNSIRDSCLVTLQNKQTEFERYKAFNDRTVDYDKLERKLNETLRLLAQKDIDIKEGLKVKAYEISIVKEKHDELVKQSLLTKSHYEGLVKEKTKYVESLENEIDKLESDKAEFSNMYDMLLQEFKECECLAQKLSIQTEFFSKEVYTELLQSFAKLEKHSISLELSLQQCQEQMKNDTVCKEKASNVFQKEREQYLEIQDLKAQLQDKNISISELKKLIGKCKGKSVETKFDKPSVVRQPNAKRISKPSVLGKPAPFSDSLERKNFSTKKSVPKTNESEGLSKTVTTQKLPQTATQAVRNTNVIKPGINSQMKDKVMPINSHVKDNKTEVEDHHRISSSSNKTKSVTVSNDSLKSRTSNVNVVCATCGKCVFNSNHDACVSKYLNDVNARTKKPKVVPISTRKPKSQANKSVATPHKKTVASESTTQKSKSYYRMLYEKTSKAWKWWIEQQCPSGYKWVPKTKTKWVPKVRNENVQKRVSFAIDNASRITNIVQLILFIVDSGCTKHMTGNLTLLCNFVEKYLGTVRFGNDQFAPILGYGDLVQGNITINRVYYVEGLNHNLFSGNDLLTGNRGSDLYTISLQETTSSTPICLMAKASPTQAWLWHRRLSHLNFDYINLLSKKDVVIGLPKLKYVKDQLCSSCEVSKAKRSSFKTKAVPSSKRRLNLLYINLCVPMRVASINGKKYILVIVDDYSRYTWTLFLCSKDETPEVLKDFLTMIQRNLQASVISVRNAEALSS